MLIVKPDQEVIGNNRLSIIAVTGGRPLGRLVHDGVSYQ